MPCWHFDEENRLHANANTQRPIWLKEETSPLVLITKKVISSMATPRNRVTHETKSTQVGLVMTMSTNDHTPSIKPTILTHRHVKWKVDGRITWIYSHKTWNPISLTMMQRLPTPNIMGSCPLPTMGAMKKMDPKVDHKCNVTNQGWSDGGGWTKCTT